MRETAWLLALIIFGTVVTVIGIEEAVMWTPWAAIGAVGGAFSVSVTVIRILFGWDYEDD